MYVHTRWWKDALPTFQEFIDIGLIQTIRWMQNNLQDFRVTHFKYQGWAKPKTRQGIGSLAQCIQLFEDLWNSIEQMHFR